MSREEIIARIAASKPTVPVMDVEKQRIVLFDARTTVGEALRAAAEKS